MTAAKYEADGVTYGTMEDTGDTYPVCDVCGHIGLFITRDGDDCPACVAKWEAAQEVAGIHGAFAFESDETQQRMLARLREIQVAHPELDRDNV